MFQKMFSIWRNCLIRRADKLLADIERAEALASTLIPIPLAKFAHKRCINEFRPLVIESRQSLCDRKASRLRAHRCFQKVKTGLKKEINYLEKAAERNRDGKLMEAALRDQAEERERYDAVIRDAKLAPLLDAAFQILMHNIRNRDNIIDAHKAGLPFTQSEIHTAVEQAGTLIDEACKLAGAYSPWLDSADYDAAELAFYERNPGFSDESYRAAIFYGCFVMR